MRRCRFIHAADLHLDSPFKGLTSLPEPLRQLIRESTYAALDRIVELAADERADFVLFSGDIYDTPDRSLRAQFRFKAALEKLSRHGIASFVIHGNHDPENGRSARLDWPERVHVFPSGRVETVPLADADGNVYAHVHGVSYRQAAERENLAARYAVQDPDVLNIAMLHANVDGHPDHDNYAPCRLDELKRSGFDYWALGHIHTPAVLHERPWIVYPGNPQGRHMKETGPRGVMLVEADEARRIRVTFRETAVIEWQRVQVDITGIGEEQELVNRLLAALDQERDGQGGISRIVRLELTGRSPLQAEWLAHEERTADLTNTLRDLAVSRWEQEGGPFVWPESVRNCSAPEWDRDELLRGEGFLSELVRCSERIARDGEARESFVSQALEDLYGNYRFRRLAGEPSPEELDDWLRWAEDEVVQLLGKGGKR